MYAKIFLAALLAVAPLSAQQEALLGSVTYFGTGCTTPDGPIAASNQSVPMLGSAFDLVYSGPNHSFDFRQTRARPHLVIGFSVFGPVVIPPLFRLQPAGCELASAHDVVLPMQVDPAGSGNYFDSVTIKVPNNGSLLGTTFFGQWLTTFTQCGFAGCTGVEWIGTSATAVCTIGP